jgi:hypothetical protein
VVAAALGLAPGCLQPGEFNNEEQFRLKTDADVPDTDLDPVDSSSGGSSGSGGSGGTDGSGGSAGSDGSGGSAGSGGSSGSGGSGGSGGARDSGQDTNQSMGVTVSLEAESGMGINAPMATADDAAASGGKYISAPTLPATNATPDTTTMGVVTYPFSVSAMGNYKVWGRVRATVDASNSFWVKMDQGPWIQWNNIMASPDWQWDDVHDTAMAEMTVTFMLSQGMHTLSVTYREQATGLDKLVITSNLNLMPTGMGP